MEAYVQTGHRKDCRYQGCNHDQRAVKGRIYIPVTGMSISPHTTLFILNNNPTTFLGPFRPILQFSIKIELRARGIRKGQPGSILGLHTDQVITLSITTTSPTPL